MRHFTIHEFRQKARRGFPRDVPYPSRWVPTRLGPLIRLLEDIRALCGDRPIVITSAYRSPAYNRAVGGARRSQHIQGRAADIVVMGLPARRVHDLIWSARNRLPGLAGLGSYARFTHVDVWTPDDPADGRVRFAHWRR